MSRKERRQFVNANPQMRSLCPHCKRPSIFLTDSTLKPRCLLCGRYLSNKTYPAQCVVKTTDRP